MLSSKDESSYAQLKQPLKKIIDYWLRSNSQTRPGSFNMVTSQVFTILTTIYLEGISPLVQFLDFTYGKITANPAFSKFMGPIRRRLLGDKEQKLVKSSPLKERAFENRMNLSTAGPDKFELKIDNMLSQNIIFNQQQKKSPSQKRNQENKEQGPKEYKLRKLDEEGNSVKIIYKK
eukprot:TRINITY_DN9949_c0_g1_i2.p1 TRINITY_DN9949_c0_g1~~TRINITY_DN9949_c0_g1_i2.p1  ORF type:complete len:176 (+),score=33.77 TRINITY_DN9949_c0_g1_i2:186-713(+)